MDRISVMIVDDSALMRNLLSKIVTQTDDLEVCATAMNGRFALEKLDRYSPEVMVLDLEMPDVNGIDFLTERKKRGITVPVIILSSLAQRGARITMDALSLGASDFLFKPTGKGGAELETVAAQLVQMIRAYGGEYRATRAQGTSRATSLRTAAFDSGAVRPEPARPREQRQPTGEPAGRGEDRVGRQAGRGGEAQRGGETDRRGEAQREGETDRRGEAQRGWQERGGESEESADSSDTAVEAPRIPPRMADPARGMPKRTPKRSPGTVRGIAI
ncbi:MAG: response regulator, partial [Spirochaetia bacterium]